MTSVDDSPLADFTAMGDLSGKGFVVAGAGQGIGRQTVAALVQSGARVVCCDILPDLAHEVADEVGGLPWVGDVTVRGEVDRLVAESTTLLGQVDGLVDIVGISHYGDAVDVDDERWQWQFDIVVRHAFLLGQRFGRAMAHAGGTMVFVCSISGLTAAPQTAPYGAAKAALISWIRSLADELGPHGIRVNGVAPGMVWTPRVSGLIGDRGRRMVAEATPLRRMAVPSEISSAILFLSTDLSSFITGQTIVVDGGITNTFPYPMAALAEISGVSGPG
jgi:NAD(P)-dependent dehydrogenase (short-subunit alcohol dehydrogenase family)